MKIQESNSGERLQKVLAQAGIGSRRHCEEIISAGRVTVNGEKVTLLGTKVNENDLIAVDGRLIKAKEAFQYYLLNKPIHVITSAKDPQGRETVIDYLKGVSERVYPVGRLDYETSGILLLTNDGELANRLMHPRFGVEKTYRVMVSGPVSEQALVNLRNGVLLEDGKTAPAKVNLIKSDPGSKLEILEITIHEGKNRQVRRMCAKVGYPVKKLERIKFGPLTLKPGMSPGSFRQLTAKEIKSLRKIVGLE